MAAIPIPYAIFLGVEICLPLFPSHPKNHIMKGVRTITKNGLTACQISGAILLVLTKSRAKNDRDCPFWWKENQKNMTTPRTAKRAYILCLISFAMASFSSCV